MESDIAFQQQFSTSVSIYFDFAFQWGIEDGDSDQLRNRFFFVLSLVLAHMVFDDIQR